MAAPKAPQETEIDVLRTALAVIEHELGGNEDWLYAMHRVREELATPSRDWARPPGSSPWGTCDPWE